MKEKLRLVLSELSAQLTDDDVRNIEELIRAGEMVLALECCCEQLYERDAVCSAQQIEELQALGEEMNVDPRYWTILAREERHRP